MYREIVPPERLVSTFEYEGAPGHVSVDTLTLEEHDGKTKLTAISVFQTREDRDAMLESGAEAGARETTERLAELLGQMQSAITDREIVLTRVFDAPRELVWKAWTDPKHVARWWGPNGFTNTVDEMDVRPGGVWRFVMHGPDGVDYKNKIVYIEVAKPERLVYSHSADDEGESEQFHGTVTFAEQGGKTALTLRLLFPTAAESERAVKEFGAIEGGNQTLKRLEEYLTRM